MAIIVLNIFAGWTVIGALVWASTTDVEERGKPFSATLVALCSAVGKFQIRPHRDAFHVWQRRALVNQLSSQRDAGMRAAG